VPHTAMNKLRALASRSMSDHLETLSWYYHRAEHFAFTRRHSLDFDGFIPRDQLVADSAESLANSNNYRPYSNFHLKLLVRKALSTGIEFQNFVDVGCGKGQPCIFARKYFKFPNLYGIDFSAPLIDVAKRNAARTPYRNVHFLVADATSWRLPDGNTLVFLFNPFNEIILERFLTVNIDHFARYRSLIAYGVDAHVSTMHQLGFESIFHSPRHQQSLLRYSASPSR
jgi:SAM-dependent methyltransferase